jgi:leucyl aminopeptidase
MKINTIKTYKLNNDDSIVVFTSKEQLKEATKFLGSAVEKVLKQFNFEAKEKEIVEIKGIFGKKLVVVGLGADKDLTTHLALSTGGIGATYFSKEIELNVFMYAKNTALINDIILGINLKCYAFDKYINTPANKTTYKIKTINVVNHKVDEKEVKALTDSINNAKNFINEPANIIYPESIVNQIKELTKIGLKVTVLNKKQLQQKGFHSLLAVSDGSDKDPYVVIMEYNNNKDQKKPLAFVGKGVTFDSGGYSLKPAGGMMDMKKDMSGAAAVVGLMQLLASTNTKVNAVGVVGFVENLVNGSAMKPGDVINSLAGKTIEVLNTDAEGRLLLADLLWYTQAEFKPEFMINLATLTGAIIVSLGAERAGLFANNKSLVEKLMQAGEETGEYLWHMPLGKEYATHLKSSIADLQNISTAPRVAGSIFAGMFLQEFVNNTPWAHLDIAGVADITSSGDFNQKGAKGFGIRLLYNFIKKHYTK